ncbi:MAG: ACP S-malonyltransferase [Pseudomonadota bacterium]
MTYKIAFLFPGQGSQVIGMGREIVDFYPETREIFDAVDTICRRPISKLCFEGPMDELTLTVNLQPAITAANLVCLAALNSANVRPTVSAGHSLGEYAALAASGIISSDDALRLAKERGALMLRESMVNPGAMAAVVGLDIEAVGKIVDEAGQKGILAVASHNTAEQVVITGEKEPLSSAMALVKEKGAKAIPLKVSGAWHCDLMKNAVDDFRKTMENIPFSPPERKMLFNATADQETDPEKIRDIMARQLTSPVKWYDIVQKMLEDEINVFVEVGPKNVLTGLLKKILPRESEVKIFNVGDSAGLHNLLESLS